MSHCDRNFGGRSRRRFRFSSSCSSSSDESTLKFKQNEVQFIPVQLHNEGSHSKYSRLASRSRKPLTNNQMKPSESSMHVHVSAESSRISVCLDASKTRKQDGGEIQFDVLLKKRTNNNAVKRKLRSQHSVVEYTDQFFMNNLEESFESRGNNGNSKRRYFRNDTYEDSRPMNDTYEDSRYPELSGEYGEYSYDETNKSENYSKFHHDFAFKEENSDYHKFRGKLSNFLVKSRCNVVLKTSSRVSYPFSRHYQSYPIEVRDFEEIKEEGKESYNGNGGSSLSKGKILNVTNSTYLPKDSRLLLANRETERSDKEVILRSTDKGKIVILLLPVEGKSASFKNVAYNSALITPKNGIIADESLLRIAPVFKTVPSVENVDDNFRKLKNFRKLELKKPFLRKNNCRVSESCRLDMLDFLEYPEGRRTILAETEDSDGMNTISWNSNRGDKSLGEQKDLVSISPQVILPNKSIDEDKRDSRLIVDTNFNIEKFIFEIKHSLLNIETEMCSIFRNFGVYGDKSQHIDNFEREFLIIDPDVGSNKKLLSEPDKNGMKIEDQLLLPREDLRVERLTVRENDVECSQEKKCVRNESNEMRYKERSNKNTKLEIIYLMKDRNFMSDSELEIKEYQSLYQLYLADGSDMKNKIKQSVGDSEEMMNVMRGDNESFDKQNKYSVEATEEVKLELIEQSQNNTEDLDKIKDFLLNFATNEVQSYQQELDECNTDSTTSMDSKQVDKTVVEALNLKTSHNDADTDDCLTLTENTDDETSFSVNKIDSIPFETASEKKLIATGVNTEYKSITFSQESVLEGRLVAKKSASIYCTTNSSFFSKEASTQKDFDFEDLKVSFELLPKKPEQENEESQTNYAELGSVLAFSSKNLLKMGGNETIITDNNSCEGKNLCRKYHTIKQANINVKCSRSADLIFSRKYIMSSNSVVLGGKYPNIQGISKFFLRKAKSAPQSLTHQEERLLRFDDFPRKSPSGNIDGIKFFLTTSRNENSRKMSQQGNIGLESSSGRETSKNGKSAETIFPKGKKHIKNKSKFIESTEDVDEKNFVNAKSLRHETRRKSEELTDLLPDNSVENRERKGGIEVADFWIMKEIEDLNDVDDIRDKIQFPRPNRELNPIEKTEHNELENKYVRKLLRHNENHIKSYNNKLDSILHLEKSIFKEKLKQKSIELHERKLYKKTTNRARMSNSYVTEDRVGDKALKRPKLFDSELPSNKMQASVQLKLRPNLSETLQGSYAGNVASLANDKMIEDVDLIAQLGQELPECLGGDEMMEKEFGNNKKNSIYANLLSKRNNKGKSNQKITVSRSKPIPGSYLAIYSKRSKFIADKKVSNPQNVQKNKKYKNLGLEKSQKPINVEASVPSIKKTDDCRYNELGKMERLFGSGSQHQKNLVNIESFEEKKVMKQSKNSDEQNESNKSIPKSRLVKFSTQNHTAKMVSLAEKSKLLKLRANDAPEGQRSEYVLQKSGEDISKKFIKRIVKNTERVYRPDIDEICRVLAEMIPKQIPPSMQHQDVSIDVPQDYAEKSELKQPPLFEKLGEHNKDFMFKTIDEKNRTQIEENVRKTNENLSKKNVTIMNSLDLIRVSRPKSARKFFDIKSDGEIDYKRRKQSRKKSRTSKVITNQSQGEFLSKSRKSSGYSQIEQNGGTKIGGAEYGFCSKSESLSAKKTKKIDKKSRNDGVKIGIEQTKKIHIKSVSFPKKKDKEDNIESKLKEKDRTNKKLRKDSSHSIKLAFLPKWRNSEKILSTKRNKKAIETQLEIPSRGNKEMEDRKEGNGGKQEKKLKRLQESNMKMKINQSIKKKNERSFLTDSKGTELDNSRKCKQHLDCTPIESSKKLRSLKINGKTKSKKIKKVCFTETTENSQLKQSELNEKLEAESTKELSDDDENRRRIESDSSSFKEISVKESGYDRNTTKKKRRKKLGFKQKAQEGNESGDEMEDVFMSRITQYSLMVRKKKVRRDDRELGKPTHRTRERRPLNVLISRSDKQDLGDGDTRKSIEKNFDNSLEQKIKDLERVNRLQKIFMEEYQKRINSKCMNNIKENSESQTNELSSNLKCNTETLSSKNGRHAVKNRRGRDQIRNEVQVYTFSTLYGLFSTSEIEFLDGMKRHFGLKSKAPGSKKPESIWKKGSKSNKLTDAGVFTKSEDKLMTQLRTHYNITSANTKPRKIYANHKDRNQEKPHKKHVRFECPKKNEEFSPLPSRACLRRAPSDHNSRDKRLYRSLFDQMMEEHLQKLKKPSKRHPHVFYEDKRLDISHHERKKTKKSKAKPKQSEDKKKSTKKQKGKTTSLIENSYQISYMIEMKAYNSIYLNGFLSKTISNLHDHPHNEEQGTEYQETTNEGLNNIVTFIRTDILRENRTLLDEIIGPNVSLQKLFKKFIFQDQRSQ